VILRLKSLGVAITSGPHLCTAAEEIFNPFMLLYSHV
jgi:hypothetical protein